MKLKDKLRKNVTVYGPYLRRDGRKHVVIYDGKKCRTVSYPKWLVEQHLGRFLKPNETVDHQDRDFTNDAIDNLIVRSKSEHASLDAVRVKHRFVPVTCVWCGKTFKAFYKALYEAGRKGTVGPFCSRRCSGMYGSWVQNGKCERLPAQFDGPAKKPEYYRVDKTAPTK